MKTFIVFTLLLLTSLSAYADGSFMTCGYAFFGPHIQFDEAGEVISAGFQDGYSSARLKCGAARNEVIVCKKPAGVGPGGDITTAYVVTFDMNNLSAKSERTFSGSAPILDTFENCQYR